MRGHAILFFIKYTLSIIRSQLHCFQLLRTILNGKDFKFFSHGGSMRIIHGYDTPYEQALTTSRIPSLSQRRDELCSTLFDKIVVQQEQQLYKYLQPNTREDKVNLRRKRPFVIPRCKTNRFKNTFLNASAINYNKIHSL